MQTYWNDGRESNDDQLNQLSFLPIVYIVYIDLGTRSYDYIVAPGIATRASLLVARTPVTNTVGSCRISGHRIRWLQELNRTRAFVVFHCGTCNGRCTGKPAGSHPRLVDVKADLVDDLLDAVITFEQKACQAHASMLSPQHAA